MKNEKLFTTEDTEIFRTAKSVGSYQLGCTEWSSHLQSSVSSVVSVVKR